MRTIFLIFTFFIPLFCFGQYQPSTDIFPSFGNYERKGWLVNPELTYMMRPLKNTESRVFLGSDTIYDIDYRASGKLGVGLEIGRFYAIENSRLISYVDFSIGAKILRGVERYEATLDDPDRQNVYTRQGEGTFSQSYVTASFNASNSIPIAKGIFLNNTIGINGDYRFAEAYTYNTQGIPTTLDDPTRFVFQAHYALGVGFKMNNRIMVIPSVETPIVNFYEYEDLKSTLGIFHSRYRPLIFRLTIMVLDAKADRKCPKKPKSRKKTSLFGMSGDRPW